MLKFALPIATTQNETVQRSKSSSACWLRAAGNSDQETEPFSKCQGLKCVVLGENFSLSTLYNLFPNPPEVHSYVHAAPVPHEN